MEKLGKLNLKQSGLFEIEVNDDGECIVLDTQDIELPLKFQKMYEDCEKALKEYNLQLAVINKKKTVNKGLLTNKDIERVKLEKKLYNTMRGVMDSVLGKDACKKIFGDRNYVDMFDDLMEALNPFLESIGVFKKEVKEVIAEKYSNSDEDTI